MIKIKINGVEHPSLIEGCSMAGLNYAYVRNKSMKSDIFEIRQIAKVEIIRDERVKKTREK